MRAETRHQLKEDRFSQAAAETVHWTVEHKSKIVIATIVLVAAAVIGFGGWYYINSQDEKASVELGAAVRILDEPIRQEGVPPQPGFPSFASSQERATEARKKFQSIVDRYPRTRTADMARYFVGLMSSQMGDYTAAERNLQETASSSSKDLAALGKFALASVYQAEKKNTQALDLYRQLADKPTATVTKLTAQLEMARSYENQQKPDEAKRIYEQIQKENPATEAAQLAQQRSEKLK